MGGYLGVPRIRIVVYGGPFCRFVLCMEIAKYFCEFVVAFSVAEARV